MNQPYKYLFCLWVNASAEDRSEYEYTIGKKADFFAENARP